MKSNFLFIIGVTLFINIVVSFSSVSTADPLCPEVLSKIPNICDRIKCYNNVTKEDCPLDTFYMEKFTMCGCCPGCAKYIGLNQGIGPKDTEMKVCTVNEESLMKKWVPNCEGPTCPIIVNKCMPGLVCNGATGDCELPKSKLDSCTEECMYKKSLKRLGLYHWDPECEVDGSYAPKQCKGDHVTGLCFCVNSCGKRIFGTEWRVDAKNQTCACSKQTHDLRSQGHIATLHCSHEGNFEPLQCDTDSSICYCVDERTGKMNGAVVPQSQWKLLPCLTPNITNFESDGRYLRKCESEYAAGKIVIRDAKAHGTGIGLRALNCDYDGSYAPVQIRGSRTECVYKNGTVIKNFFTSGANDMDCYCARDQFFYQITGKPFSFGCGGDSISGNYDVLYNFGSFSSCVDRDGIPYGDLVPSKYTCCLDKTCIDALGILCKNEKNPDGYTACCDWPFGGACKG